MFELRISNIHYPLFQDFFETWKDLLEKFFGDLFLDLLTAQIHFWQKTNKELCTDWPTHSEAIILLLEHCGSQQCCRFVWKDFWLACLVPIFACHKHLFILRH